MNSNASRRLRFRLSSHEQALFSALLEAGPFRTRSHLVRAAVRFSEKVRATERQEARVVLLDITTGVRTRIGIAQAMEASRAEPLSAGFMELRVSQADAFELNALRDMEATGSLSEAMRTALRLFATAADGCRMGHQVMAETVSGELIPLVVPGYQSAGMRFSCESRQESGDSDNPIDSLDRLVRFLPRSLLQAVEKLAREEGCTTETLIIDMIRSEVCARSKGQTKPDSRADRATGDIEQFEEAPLQFFDTTPSRPAGTQSVQRAAPSTMPVVARGAESGWALVVSEDSWGRPQEQVVTPDAVVPIELDELEELRRWSQARLIAPQ